MISAGRIPARATEYQCGAAKTGTQQIAVTFELLAGPNRGQPITWFGYLTEKAYQRTFNSLRAMGLPDGVGIADIDAQTHLTGLVHLVIAHEVDDRGQQKAKVQWVNRPGEGGFTMKGRLKTDEDRRKYNAQWAQRLAATEAVEPVEVPDQAELEAQASVQAAGAAPKQSSGGSAHPFAPDNEQEQPSFGSNEEMPF